MPYSKQPTQCGHCNVKMRRDRLPKHTDEKHPGCVVKDKKAVESRSLFDYMRGQGGKRKCEDTDDEAEASPRKRAKLQSDADDETRDETEECEMQMETDRATDHADDHETQTASTSITARDNPSGNPSASNDQDSNKGLSAKLDQVLEKLSKLDVGGMQSKNKGRQEPDIDYTKEVEALQVLVQASKSIRRLCDLARLTSDEDNNMLYCDVCCSVGSVKSRAGGGHFGYNFSNGVDFTKIPQTTEFGNLKRAVARHAEGKAHINNLQIQQEENEKLQKLRKQEQCVGVTLGKQSYRLLKYCRPFADYEVDLKLLSDAKVKIGNINHSRQFPSKLRPCFADAIDSRVKDYISTPLQATKARPPFGLVADKLTARRRTGQMYAGILFTPGMEDLLSPVSLGVTSVKKHDGQGITDDIVAVCSEYSIDNNQLAGFGFDGQYFHLGVDSKLKDKLNLDEKVGFTWDLAHLLQLADKDTRKECAWIEETCNSISAILSKFSFGKTFEEAIDKARELDLEFKAPLWFSETRFAAYAHLVFKNFIENYQVVRQVLEKVAESDDQRAPDACALLRRIRGLAFVVKLLLCCDFYSIMGKVSKTLQLVNVPIWSKLNAVEEFLQALQDFIQKGKDALPTYQKHEEDLQKCIFQTHPVLLSDVGINMPLRQTRTRGAGADDEHEEPDLVNTKLDHLLQKSASLADHMTTKMNTRFTPEFIAEIKEKEQAASLLPILLRARKAANETEMLASSEVQTLTGMHPAHAEEIRNLCINFYRNYKTLADVNTEIELYHKVFTDPNLSNGASHALQTIAKIFCSNPPESIVESMGSIIDKICCVRGGSKTSTNKRDVKDISDELKIHWNGPHISNCEKIVNQALEIHFKGGPWHFMTFDVRSKLHRVSKVVDKINATKPKLSFMV